MRQTIFITLIALIFGTMQGMSQTYSHKEVYDQDFVFTDGIYLSKDDFKNNLPIEKSQISSNLDPSDLSFFEQLIENKTIAVFDKLGSEINIDVSKIFGFCSSGNVYINCNGSFEKIGIIGNICHFLGTKTVYHSTGNPYMGYGRYSPFGPSYMNTTSKESQQYIFSMETGKLMEYNTDNLKTMLMADPALHDEYANLSRKKQKAQLYYYMRLYNQKHPLYVPVYE